MYSIQMFLGKCRRHSCPDDTVCVPDGATSSKRYSCEPSDTNGNQTTNVTGTQLQIIGVGYNLLTGNPEMTEDPGVLLSSRVLQLTELDTRRFIEASVTQGFICTNTEQHALVHGSTSLQNEMKEFVQASCMYYVGLSVVTLADFGTWTMERHRLSVPALFQQVFASDPSVLDLAGYFNGHASSRTINMNRYDRSSLLTHSFGSPDQLTVGKLSNPKPIRMEVTPISDFIQWSFFQSIVCELKARHECVDTMQAHDLQLIANNVRKF
ncbi:hypothetical protein MAR_009629 [Mya arenaria]|uniref:Uncharacterized protein n=1 Tax=Mya arenaria TaxID=6604 RepID=A0ABY7E7E7_MYAAR|nr:hypothetical protein MAR_009629 [Mya arenaria]